MRGKNKLLGTLISGGLAVGVAQAETGLTNPNISLILSGGYTERSADFQGMAQLPIAEDHVGGPEQGFWLGETELGLSAQIDRHFYGKLTLVFEQHEGEIETELEEAFVQTTALPYGLGMRAGHFLANIGYQNTLHGHANPFIDRPLAVQAFLGGHYHDDGVRLNWIAPFDIYLELGGELLQGGRFPASNQRGIGARTLFMKTGADWGTEHSWQMGLSWSQFDNHSDACASHEHEEGDDDTDTVLDEAEAHHDEAFEFCQFEGEREYWVWDGVWKWAPQGNYKYRSLTLNAELFQVQDQGSFEQGEHVVDTRSRGGYLSGIYQLNSEWSLGARYNRIQPDQAYGTHSPVAWDALLSWHPSHFSQVRLQWSRQDLQDAQETVWSVQYQMSLGAHNAHTF